MRTVIWSVAIDRLNFEVGTVKLEYCGEILNFYNVNRVVGN